MAFNFEKVHATYDSWYKNELKRPIFTSCFNEDFPEKTPDWFTLPRFESYIDHKISPKRLIDCVEYELQFKDFDAFEGFPNIPMQFFGPGYAAALMGCEAHSAKHTVWFEPKNKQFIPIEQLHVEYDENNIWWNRIRAVYQEACNRFKGDVVIQMFDVGGVMDILASFIGTEQLLVDCIEQPEEVSRCVNDIQGLWFRYFDEINAILKPTTKGYSFWAGFLCREPSYIFQSDFCYMISPAMFKNFVRDELASSSARVPNAVYHMDGLGQLAFTDMILGIDSIKTIQWVPGDGEALLTDWTELHKKIIASGKKAYVTYKGVDDFPTLYRTIGDPGALYLHCGGKKEEKAQIMEKVEKDLEDFYAGK